MAAIEKAEELATRYLEDFDISTPEQRYEGLRWRVFQAIAEAVAEERERIAKKNDNRAKELSHPILGETNDQYWARVGRLEEARSIATAIRKVKA